MVAEELSGKAQMSTYDLKKCFEGGCDFPINRKGKSLVSRSDPVPFIGSTNETLKDIAKGDEDTLRAYTNRIHNLEMLYPCYHSQPSEDELLRLRRALKLPPNVEPKYYLVFKPKRFAERNEIISLEKFGGHALFNLMLRYPEFSEDLENYRVFTDGDTMQNLPFRSKFHVPVASVE